MEQLKEDDTSKYIAAMRELGKDWIFDPDPNTGKPRVTQIYTTKYRWGEAIGTAPDYLRGHTNKIILGIVLGGLIEIFEVHDSFLGDTYYAYRPVRILEAGDIFNDFSAIDQHIFPESNSRESRPGEEWTIRAGLHSSLIARAQKKGASAIREKLPQIEIYEPEAIDSEVDDKIKLAHEKENLQHKHSARAALHDANAKSTILVGYILIDFAECSDNFMINIMKSGWRRLLTYRNSPNSYNAAYRHGIVAEGIKIIDDLVPDAKTGESYKYNPKHNRYDIQEVFIEAIFDAVNRPDRHEPVFFKFNKCNHILSLEKSHQDGMMVSKRVREEDKEFYFPIDFANHMIASLASRRTSAAGNDKSSNSGKFSKRLLSGFSISDAIAPIGAARDPAKPDKDIIYTDRDGLRKGTEKHFWKTAAEKIVRLCIEKINLSRDCNYEYNIEVITLFSEHGHGLLFLKFEKNSK